MATLQEILARAQALRDETALGSIDPERAGSIMYDTLQVINQMQLNGGALVITKIYASVAAMEADDAPVSDLTGNALKPGQLVVIVTTDTSSSDFGSVYRFDGIEDSASTWSFTGKIGGYPMDETPTEGSTRAVTSGGVYTAVSGLIVNQDYEVDTNAKRTQTYTIASGTRIVIKVTKTGGTGTTYNAYWIKSGGNVAIFTAKSYGYVSEVLTVPDDATGVSIFMNTVAVGNTRNVKIYDASYPAYLTETTPILETRLSTEEGKTAILESKAVPFTGTDGVNAGTQGFVPAPAATDKGRVLSANGSWVDAGGYFYNVNEQVTTTGQRSKNYVLTPGSKIIFKVSVVSGTGATFNAAWIKTGGNESIISSAPMGYISDILTVPNDATGINIFMSQYAAGNVNKVQIWDASRGDYITEKIGSSGLNYLNNRRAITKTFTLATGNTQQELFSNAECVLANLTGDIYAEITGTAKFDYNSGLRFWNTTDTIAPSGFLAGVVMKDGRKIYHIFDSATLNRVNILANVITTGGTLTITIFAIDPSVEKFSLPLYGQQIISFGDSLTDFRPAVEDKRYTDYLADISGADVLNIGIGGTRLAYRRIPTTTPADNQDCVAAFDIVSLVTAWANNDYSCQDAAIASGLLTAEQQPNYETKLARLKANPVSGLDMVTIFGGANDYTGGSPIGTPAADNTDKGTVYGAINSMVSALLTAKPTLKIYFFSPLYRMFEDTVSLATSSDVYIHPNAPGGKTLAQFCEDIQDAVRLNHEPFCAWYWSFGWNLYNFTEYFGTDMAHPYRGFHMIAEKMYKFLLTK